MLSYSLSSMLESCLLTHWEAGASTDMRTVQERGPCVPWGCQHEGRCLCHSSSDGCCSAGGLLVRPAAAGPAAQRTRGRLRRLQPAAVSDHPGCSVHTYPQPADCSNTLAGSALHWCLDLTPLDFATHSGARGAYEDLQEIYCGNQSSRAAGSL